MTITYKTDGAWGTGIGVPLTAAQVDTNFYGIDTRLIALETADPTCDVITGITLIGSQLSIFTTSSSFGPFTVPIAVFHWTDEFEYSHDYSELEIFRYSPPSTFASGGVYLVMSDHTSDDDTFDENALDGDSNPLYTKLFSIPAPTPIEFDFYHVGVVTEQEVLFRRATSFPFIISTTSDGFPNIGHYADVNPAAPTVFAINKVVGGVTTQIGILTVDDAGLAEILIDDTYGTDVLFTRNDMLEILAPLYQDYSHENFGITISVAAL